METRLASAIVISEQDSVATATRDIKAGEKVTVSGGGKEYENMVQDLTARIIEDQSTEVDGITGATVSSNNLKQAVENALQPQGE